MGADGCREESSATRTHCNTNPNNASLFENHTKFLLRNSFSKISCRICKTHCRNDGPPMMPSFYTGDELGNIKHVSCSKYVQEIKDKSTEGSQWKLEDRIVLKANNSSDSTSKELSIQKIASAERGQKTIVRPPESDLKTYRTL